MSTHLDLSKVDATKYHSVVWSGGSDSTLLLHDVASRYGTPDRPVMAVSIDHFLLDPDKKINEIRCRENLKKIFAEKGLHIRYETITITGEIGIGDRENGGNPQAFFWLTTAIAHACGENLYLGFVKVDDVWQYRTELDRLISVSADLMGTKSNVVFPMAKYDKPMVFKELERRGLYDHIWYCEVPAKGATTPCGKCTPCETHLNGLLNLVAKGDEWAVSKLNIDVMNKIESVIRKHKRNKAKK